MPIENITISNDQALDILRVLSTAYIYVLLNSEHTDELPEDFKPHKWEPYVLEYAQETIDQYKKLLRVMTEQAFGDEAAKKLVDPPKQSTARYEDEQSPAILVDLPVGDPVRVGVDGLVFSTDKEATGRIREIHRRRFSVYWGSAATSAGDTVWYTIDAISLGTYGAVYVDVDKRSTDQF